MLTNPDDERILVLAPVGRDAPLLQTVLSQAGFRCTLVSDASTLDQSLQERVGALLFTEEALVPAILQTLNTGLANQPEWSNLPLVLLVDERTHQDVRRVVYQTLGADKKLTLLERPVPPKTLVEVMQATLWVRRRQYQTRDLLAQLAAQNAALAHEVAERQRTEAALRESDERLRAALAASATGTFRWNLRTNQLQCDASLMRLFGLSAGQTMQTLDEFIELVYPEDRPSVRERCTQSMQIGADIEMEFRVLWPDGSLHWLYDRGKAMVGPDGRPLEMTGACTEITKPKQAEADLQASQRLTQSIIDTSPTIIYINDLQSQQNVYMSPQAAIMLGYTAAEFKALGSDLIPQLMHPDDRAQMPAYFQQLRATVDGEILEHEYRIQHKQGAWRWFISFDTPFLRTADGAPQQVLGVALDITARKQAEVELRTLNTTLEQRVRERTAELERSNRELDQFAYVASHDLKAPLRSINHLATWLSDDAAAVLPATSQAHLDKMRGRIKRMETLLNDLLAYSRAGRQSFKIEPVSIATLVKGIVDLLAPPPGFTVTIKNEMPALPVERVPLETVLRNLIGNALKHHYNPQIGQVQIDVQAQSQVVEFTVADNGPGIDPTFHERIFQVFQTLKPRDEVEGSGMGLAIVKKLIESRHGTIQVESSLGNGATFRFTWPLVEKR